jgi:cytoskeletal protein CcmA (bactofilin family)
MAGESLVIKGDIVCNEDLRFDGQIEGTISLPEHTLIVGPKSRIAADVQAKAIVVAGTLTGTIAARERFELQDKGNLEGSVEAPRIAVHEGAFLRATVTMPARA